MIGAQKCDRCGFAFNTCPCRDKPSSRDVAAVGGVNPNGFACGRCDECDGGRGHLFCLRPRGGSRPHDVAAAGGGEQSLTAAELETVALRRRVAELERKLSGLSNIREDLAEVCAERDTAEALLRECREWICDNARDRAHRAIIARIDEALR